MPAGQVLQRQGRSSVHEGSTFILHFEGGTATLMQRSASVDRE
jgi:hypothetical protein